METVDWRAACTKADAYKAIGQTDVYLFGDNGDDYPYADVVRCEPGGTHRLDMDTSCMFYANHPCGLSFRWSFDVELRSANGKGHYEIDVAGCQRVLGRLQGKARDQFRRYLWTCAEKVSARASEYLDLYNRQCETADALNRAAEQVPTRA